MQEWRLLGDITASGAYQMALDEALLLADCQMPTLRLYNWKPYAVSLGYLQEAEQIDIGACRRLGIDIVRRPTGGRGVLHQYELTYSLVTPLSHIPKGSQVVASYCYIAQGLLSAIRQLGLNGCLVNYKSSKRNAAGRSAVCFSANSWYEILVDGKKIIGSAQRRIGNSFLQHGSILIDVDYETLSDIFYQPGMRDARIKELRQQIAGINQYLNCSIDEKALKQAIIDGFSKALGIYFTQGRLNEAEEQLTRKLYQEKYSHPAWNLRKVASRYA